MFLLHLISREQLVYPEGTIVATNNYQQELKLSYANSFLPSAIKLWNNLTQRQVNVITIESSQKHSNSDLF